jgi:hypothetical protein
METMPETLNAAMATEPLWLKSWLFVLVGVHFASLLFFVQRASGRWKLRPEPIAVFASFLLAGLLMNWLYAQVGYVRLLGLAHLVAWTPAYVWVLKRRRANTHRRSRPPDAAYISSDVAAVRVRACENIG